MTPLQQTTFKNTLAKREIAYCSKQAISTFATIIIKPLFMKIFHVFVNMFSGLFAADLLRARAVVRHFRQIILNLRFFFMICEYKWRKVFSSKCSCFGYQFTTYSDCFRCCMWKRINCLHGLMFLVICSEKVKR